MLKSLVLFVCLPAAFVFSAGMLHAQEGEETPSKEAPSGPPKVIIGVNLGADETGRPQVTGVSEGLPAQKAGMQTGDVIVKVGGESVRDIQGIVRSLVGKEPGEKLEFTVEREGKLETLTLKLEARPEPPKEQGWEEVRDTGGLETPWDPVKSVEYILAHQKENGSWASPFDGGAFDGSGMVVATTALVCQSLLEYRDLLPDKIPAAVEKGVRFCLEGKNPPRGIGAIWGDLYSLELAARMVREPAWEEQAEEWRNGGRKALERILQSQGTGGGWRYGHGRSATSTCFHTAEGVLILQKAKEAGFDVPPDVTGQAVDLLKRMRSEKGYLYSNTWRREVEKEGDGWMGSCGRIAAADLALFRQKAIDRQGLQETLGKFMKYRSALLTARRGELDAEQRSVFAQTNQTRPDFFAFYAYYYASLAVQNLPPETGREWGESLRRDVLSLREPDTPGSTGMCARPPRTPPGGRCIPPPARC